MLTNLFDEYGNDSCSHGTLSGRCIASCSSSDNGKRNLVPAGFKKHLLLFFLKRCSLSRGLLKVSSDCMTRGKPWQDKVFALAFGNIHKQIEVKLSRERKEKEKPPRQRRKLDPGSNPFFQPAPLGGVAILFNNLFHATSAPVVPFPFPAPFNNPFSTPNLRPKITFPAPSRNANSSSSSLVNNRNVLPLNTITLGTTCLNPFVLTPVITAALPAPSPPSRSVTQSLSPFL